MTAPAQHLLGGTDKAAIMVMLLAEEDASRILSQLTPDELRQLAGTMCGIGEVEPQAISDAISGFSRSTAAVWWGYALLSEREVTESLTLAGLLGKAA